MYMDNEAERINPAEEPQEASDAEVFAASQRLIERNRAVYEELAK